MKTTLILLSTIVLLFNSEKLIASGYDIIVVMDIDDTTSITGTIVTEIKFKDKGFKTKCTYNDAINYLKEKASENNANVIKITEHKYPDAWSTCHRMEAKLYKVENVRTLEKEIFWTAGRLLVPEDFKAEKSPIPASGLGAVSDCGISFSSSAANAFAKVRFSAHAIFTTKRSWIHPEHLENKVLLNHEQKHFDLCELYARKVYKELLEAGLTAATLQQANNIYKNVFDEYNERQYKYDSETEHGTNLEEQAKWDTIILEELNSLSAYADHL
jgi:hypothetical protein